MGPRTFVWESNLNHATPDVFAWHARPGAFERFNPSWRPVRVTHDPHSIRDGAAIALSLPLLGPVAIPWSLRHRDYREGEQFCDEQVSGPFRSWRHIHSFVAQGPSSCLMRDSIQFELPCGTSFATPLFLRELKRLFHFRHSVLKSDLDLHSRFKDLPRKTILVSGSSGFIGTALCGFLSTGGHSVIRLVRRAAKNAGERSWDPERGELNPSVFDGVDVVIHLGGESLLAKRWTPEFKKRIVSSRVKSSSLLCHTISRLERKPEAVIMASATGFYGDTGGTAVDERSPMGSGFLAHTCKEWEESAVSTLNDATRLVLLRIGTVLNPKGGALKQMLPVFKVGGGGPLGNGKQFVSWIALQDLLGIIEHAIFTQNAHGPINAVSPNSVSSREFAKTLGRALRRPAFISTPAPLMRAMFGEVADEILLSSSRVVPTKILESGYVFQFPSLIDALRFECGMPE